MELACRMIVPTNRNILLFQSRTLMTKLSFMCSLHLKTVGNSSRFHRILCTAPSHSLEEIKEIKSSVGKRKIEKVAREPFVRNFFVGKFDKGVLPFPEILEIEELTEVNKMVNLIKELYRENVNSKNIAKLKEIPDSIMEKLKVFGLFSQQIPKEYGGLELTATEFARISEEIGFDTSVRVALAAHESLGMQTILLAGNNEQKLKYLPKLSSGEYIAAFCLSEEDSGIDANQVKTSAVLDTECNHYKLTGCKHWVTNGRIADIFIVYAHTIEGKSANKSGNIPSLFIVEKSFGGISVHEIENTTGLSRANICTVTFDNTPVPVENILKKSGSGFKIATEIMNCNRFGYGASTVGFLKDLLNQTVAHTIETKRFNRLLINYDLVQERLSKLACSVYALESMVYLTAGLLDTVEKPDCSVENAILRIFASETMWECVNESIDLLGVKSCSDNHPLQIYLKDAHTLKMFQGTDELLKLFIGTIGCQYFGKIRFGDIDKLRNGLQYPLFAFKRLAYRGRVMSDNTSLKMDICGHLHPSLKDPADFLERGILRLEFITECVLRRHGTNVMDQHMQLRRLADISIYLYALTATLSRSSRSYSLGIRNSDFEIQIARTFTMYAEEKIMQLIKEIEDGSFLNNDVNYKSISKSMLQNKGYAVEHALTRVW